jgi:hypothetical protein
VIGANLYWSEAAGRRPGNARDWNDPTYAGSSTVQFLDGVSNYVATHGNGAFLMVITVQTPGWAACPGDTIHGGDSVYYPPQNAADYGDFMYAMSERYSGGHTNNQGTALGFVRDWVVYNEVNTTPWWRNSACNTGGADPVYYYGGILNQAYNNVHHVANVRVLAGALASYNRLDYQGTAGLRTSVSYSDWQAQTAALESGRDNSVWISPTDFVAAMAYYGLQFDALALHPYSPRIWDDPLLQPPAGAVSLGNLDVLLNQLRQLWPNGQNSQWHLCLTEYMLQSGYGSFSGYDQNTVIGCPNYFCGATSVLS